MGPSAHTSLVPYLQPGSLTLLLAEGSGVLPDGPPAPDLDLKSASNLLFPRGDRKQTLPYKDP